MIYNITTNMDLEDWIKIKSFFFINTNIFEKGAGDIEIIDFSVIIALVVIHFIKNFINIIWRY